MFKEIEELVDHLVLILLMSCVLGEAWKSCVDSVNWGLKYINYICLGWGEGKGGILLVILLCKFKKPPVPL